jgi:hypothetical protein
VDPNSITDSRRYDGFAWVAHAWKMTGEWRLCASGDHTIMCHRDSFTALSSTEMAPPYV